MRDAAIGDGATGVVGVEAIVDRADSLGAVGSVPFVMERLALKL